MPFKTLLSTLLHPDLSHVITVSRSCHSGEWSTFCLPELVGSRGLYGVKALGCICKSSSANKSWRSNVRAGPGVKAGVEGRRVEGVTDRSAGQITEQEALRHLINLCSFQKLKITPLFLNPNPSDTGSAGQVYRLTPLNHMLDLSLVIIPSVK